MSQNVFDVVARVLYYNEIDIFIQQQDTSHEHKVFCYEGEGEMIYKIKMIASESIYLIWFPYVFHHQNGNGNFRHT